MQKLRGSLTLEVDSPNPPKLGSPDARNHPTVGKRMPILQIPKQSRPCQTISLLLHRTSKKQLDRIGIPCKLSRPLKRKNGVAGLTHRRKQQKKPGIMPIPPRNSFLIIHQSFKNYWSTIENHIRSLSYQIQYFHRVSHQQLEIVLTQSFLDLRALNPNQRNILRTDIASLLDPNLETPARQCSNIYQLIRIFQGLSLTDVFILIHLCIFSTLLWDWYCSLSEMEMVISAPCV